jgi:chromosome segregation ATPase
MRDVVQEKAAAARALQAKVGELEAALAKAQDAVSDGDAAQRALLTQVDQLEEALARRQEDRQDSQSDTGRRALRAKVAELEAALTRSEAENERLRAAGAEPHEGLQQCLADIEDELAQSRDENQRLQDSLNDALRAREPSPHAEEELKRMRERCSRLNAALKTETDGRKEAERKLEQQSRDAAVELGALQDRLEESERRRREDLDNARQAADSADGERRSVLTSLQKLLASHGSSAPSEPISTVQH